MTDPVGRLLETYAEGLEQEPRQPTNINRLEQRVRGTLRQRSAQRTQTVRRLQWGLALAASFALISVGAAYKLGQDDPASTATAVVPAGEWLSTTTGAPQERKFEDGSTVRVESASSARVQFVQAKGGLVHLDRGAVRLKVKHRDGSTWRVAAGPYEVEAIGTEFVVDWVAGRDKPLRVSVTEGTVAVRGPAFRGTRFVSAHQVVEVTGQEAASVEPQAMSVDELAPEVAPEEPGGARVRSADSAKWRELEAQGKYGEALKAAERRGLSSIYQTASGDDLIVLARAAGNAKRADVAREALMACRARFAGSSHAAMAAFRLGQSARGKQAAEWFSTYLREQPNGGLAREALGRLVEAHQAAGDNVSARAAAERYLKSYPDGPHATLARQALNR